MWGWAVVAADLAVIVVVVGPAVIFAGAEVIVVTALAGVEGSTKVISV